MIYVEANLKTLKRHGAWRSSTVKEEYLADIMKLKNKPARLFAGVSEVRIEASISSLTVVNNDSSSMENRGNSGNSFSGKYDNCRFIFVKALWNDL